MRPSTFPAIWDKKHVKALLGLGRHPISLIQTGVWKDWMNEHGGKLQVLEYVCAAPLSVPQKQLLEVILAYPHASPVFYAGKLHLTQSPYFARLADLVAAITELLNAWQLPEKDQTPKRDTPSNLPSALTPLIGAEKSLASVVAILQRPGTRLLTLVGPGGVGKTRLAMAAGATLLQDFSDGVFFAPLETITDPALLITQVARSVNLETVWGKSKSLVDALKAYLREQNILLILDNFEQLIQSAETVAELLQSTSKLKILATSREALNITGETRYNVPELSRPDPNKLPPIEAFRQWPALDLFVRRVQARHPEFVVNQTNLETIARICHRLDGLPLAIELAAAQVRLLAPNQALPQPEYELKTLKDKSRDRSSRQRTLWDAMDWSYQLLPQKEKDVFRQLAVFGREWGLEAAQAVSQADDLLTILEYLADKSLLRSLGQDEEGDARFQMLQPVREYAIDRLADSGETERTQRRHAKHYLAMIQKAEPFIGTPNQLRWMRHIRQERENLQIALQWMLDQKEIEMAFNLLGAAWRYYNMLNMWDETKSWIDSALAQGANIKSAGKVKTLWGAAWLATHYNDWAQEMTFAEEGLTLAREMNDPYLIGLLLQNIADGLRNQKKYEQALLIFEESLALFRQIDNREEIAWVLDHIAAVAAECGEYTHAMKNLQESLAIFRTMGHQPGIAATLWQIGVVAIKDGDIGLAIDAAVERLALFRATGAKQTISQTLYELASLLWQQGNTESPKALIEENLALSREVKDQHGTARALHFLGQIALQRSDLKGAREFFEQAQTIFRQIGDPQMLASILTDIERLDVAEKNS